MFYKYLVMKTFSQMTEEKASMFEDICIILQRFALNMHQRNSQPSLKWLDMLVEHMHYKEEQGDCQIPRQGKDGDPDK